ncbi:MAG: hypothetical protein EA376_11060 [Phycisphaeraceae bacterium]|nr:MAG: hypothetical protein EA376_11060 [Phycisphaeraceae bacterium]
MVIRGMSLVALLTLLMGGCAATGPGAFDVPAGSYAEAFDAARDELRAMGFVLDRVDARHGVITTRSRPTAGLATPWLGGESSPSQSIDGTLNRQARWVEIRFSRRDGEVTPEGGDAGLIEDLRLYPGPLWGEVEAMIQRAQRPGLRVPAASVRLASPSIDPSLVDQGLYPAHTVEIGPDDRLAARLAAAITRGLPPAGE